MAKNIVTLTLPMEEAKTVQEAFTGTLDLLRSRSHWQFAPRLAVESQGALFSFQDNLEILSENFGMYFKDAKESGEDEMEYSVCNEMIAVLTAALGCAYAEYGTSSSDLLLPVLGKLCSAMSGEVRP